MISLYRSGTVILLCTVLGACVSGPQQAPPRSVSEAEKLQAAGVAKYKQHDYETAYQNFSKALHQYRIIDNPEGIVSSSINIARTLYAGDQTLIARQWADKAAELNADYQYASSATLSQHIELLSASIDTADDFTDSAKQKLESLLERTKDRDIILSALQLRTQIAFEENSGQADWLQRYATAVGANSSTSHKARLARFKAQAETNSASRDRYYSDALALYRDKAHKPGIAATLHEWARADIDNARYAQADNKLKRALLIRLELRDRRDSQHVLQSLEKVSTATGDSAQQKNASHWHEKLNDKGFIHWQSVMRDFDSFPR